MKVIKFNPQDGIRGKAHRKEKNFNEQYTAFIMDGGELKTVVTLRVYLTNAMAYCCLWANNKKVYCSGSGSAGGYGYHRPSAAAWEAVDSAGFKLSENISGVGDDAMVDAVKAIAKKLYPRHKIYTHKAHA